MLLSQSAISGALLKISRFKLAVLLALLLSVAFSPGRAEAQADTLTTAQVSGVIARLRSGSDIRLSDALVLGQVLIAEKRFGEAYDLFSAVLEKEPDDPTALYGAGLCGFNIGKTVEAEKLARAAVQVALTALEKQGDRLESRTHAADALVLLAVVLAVRGNDDEALQRAKQAVRIDPNHFDAQFTLGRALYGSGDTAKAADAFRAAIALKPGDTQALFFLGTTLERAGNVTGAISCYRQLIAQQPGVAQGHLGLGILLVRNTGKQFDEGINELKRALDIDPNSYEGRIALGRAFIINGRPSESIPHLLAATQLAPGNPEPHYQLSLAYRRLGLKEKAAQEASLVKQIHATRRGPNSEAPTAP